MFKKSYLLQQSVILSLEFIFIEILFKYFAFETPFTASLPRIILFSIAGAILITVICGFLPGKWPVRAVGLVGIIFAACAIGQLQFLNFMGNFMSIKAASAGGHNAVREYFITFMSSIRPVTWLFFAIPLAGIVFSWFFPVKPDRRLRPTVAFLCVAAALDLLAMNNVTANNLGDLYRYPSMVARSLQEFGIVRFEYRDFATIGQEQNFDVDVDPVIIRPDKHSEEEKEEHRLIDDKDWIALMDAEQDEDIKTIDKFLLNRPVTDYNEYTAALEGKNLIYIMVEAFDYMAIDPVLTPTLYSMKENGMDFTTHFTPKYSCTTGESEFISEVSLIPESSVCTPNTYAWNDWNESIFGVFEERGYYTSAYHNWKDEFYYRREIYASSGCELYLNYEDLDYERLYGWQSDLQMMQLTLPYYIDKEHFMTLYVTSSTHFPYDIYSALGDKYLDQIDAVHPDYPIEVKRYISKAMELDAGMQYLIDQLTAAGKMDDTVIVLFADHHPLYMSYSYMATYINEPGLDRNIGQNMDRTPFFIYGGGVPTMKIDTVNSTFDILPTIYNMFNMNYDPRMYLGTDIFSDQEKIVYFTTGDWITEKGEYYVYYDRFDPYNPEEELPEGYVDSMNRQVSNCFNISSMIYRSDYFKHRASISRPKDSSKNTGYWGSSEPDPIEQDTE